MENRNSNEIAAHPVKTPSSSTPSRILTVLLLLAGFAGSANANTTDPSDLSADDERYQKLEAKVDILTEEVLLLRSGDLSSPIGASVSGLGAAASRVFGAQGLSLGGYGEGIYNNFRSGGVTDQADFLRAILYVGYKFNSTWVLNTEIEIEHADEIFLEFAALDYLYREELNFRAGLVLIPMGFLNEQHEPTSFYPVRRTDIESFILPSTWRENGVGIYGECDQFAYRAYVVNGFDGQNFRAQDGLRKGRQKGSKAKANDLAGVARLDYIGLPGFLIGGSYYVGHSAQDVDGINGKVSIMEAHAEVNYRGFRGRALWADAEVEDVAALATANGAMPAVGDVIGQNLQGGYLEGSFDVFSLTEREDHLTPFIRWESYDLQRNTPMGFMATGAFDVRVTTVGLAWQPNKNLILKADFQNYDSLDHSHPNQFNLGMGYIF